MLHSRQGSSFAPWRSSPTPHSQYHERRTGSAASRSAHRGAGVIDRHPVLRPRLLHHLDDRDDHRFHPGAVRGAADADPVSASLASFVVCTVRAAASVRHRAWGPIRSSRGSTATCPSTASASATSWMRVQQKISGDGRADLPSGGPGAAAAGGRAPEAAGNRRWPRPRRARGPPRRRPPPQPGAHPGSADSRREHAHRRLHLFAPQLVLPDSADVLVRPVPGVFHAELARPHQPQLSAVLSRGRPAGRGAQPAGYRRHGARLRGGQLPAGAAAGGDQLDDVLGDAPAVSAAGGAAERLHEPGAVRRPAAGDDSAAVLGAGCEQCRCTCWWWCPWPCCTCSR